jgi:serine protease Do
MRKSARLIGTAAILIAWLYGSGGAYASPPSSESLAPLLEKVLPAVVTIRVQGQHYEPVELLPGVPPREPRLQPFRSGGTGIIFDAEQGLIATNEHVVEGSSAIDVDLDDGRSAAARLIGVDAGTDIAILKIDLHGLVPLPLGDSDKVAVGDFVVAVGNPFGLQGTATAGIVSGLMRSDVGHQLVESFIQTDAAINPGNSGGALVNMKGELVGINTVIAGSHGNIGIGFAIPTNMARRVGAQIVKYGNMPRGVIGMKTGSLPLSAAQELGLPKTRGALITEVVPGSPADFVDIKPGNAILSVNRSPIHSNKDYLAWAGSSAIGDPLDVEVTNGKLTRMVQLVVSDMRVDAKPVTIAPATPLIGGLAVAGIEPGTPLYGKIQGAVIHHARPGSPAALAGFRAGDVIVSINGAAIRDGDQLIPLAEGATQIARIDLRRDGVPYFIRAASPPSQEAQLPN